MAFVCKSKMYRWDVFITHNVQYVYWNNIDKCIYSSTVVLNDCLASPCMLHSSLSTTKWDFNFPMVVRIVQLQLSTSAFKTTSSPHHKRLQPQQPLKKKKTHSQVSSTKSPTMPGTAIRSHLLYTLLTWRHAFFGQCYLRELWRRNVQQTPGPW